MEQLEVWIDGVTYTLPRRKFKSGKDGFLLSAGAFVHGRRVWVQVLVMDRPEMLVEDRLRKTARNRALKKAKARLEKG